MSTSTKITTATQNLIAKINKINADLLTTDKNANQQTVKFVIRTQNYKVGEVFTNYIQVVDSARAKFFVGTFTGDILKVARFNCPLAGAVGNVLNDDSGLSAFVIGSDNKLVLA